MDLITTPIGIVTFGIMAVLCAYFSRYSALGALSLPCITLLTTLVYYYVMPGLAFAGGNTGYLGVYIDSMEWVHWAVFLYALGVAAACLIGRRHLAVHPAASLAYERPLNATLFWGISGIAALGLTVLTVTNRLNLTASDAFTVNENFGSFAFLQLSISMILPLVMVYAVRENFSNRAIAVICAAAFVFLVSGFRFRIAILMIAVAASYCMLRGRQPGLVVASLGITASLLIFNAIGVTRQYSVGLDLSGLADTDWTELVRSFGGEIGPIYAFFGVIEYPPAELIGLEPWAVAVARLIPSFLWPDKPYPTYLLHYTVAFDENTRQFAGIAGPQQAEILMQFGWLGLLFLPVVYFLLILAIISRLNRLSREARIAGAALIPGVFGFYMQQRGYFFQNLVEAIFIIGPLFFMHAPLRPMQASNPMIHASLGSRWRT